jgi:hypothetical protein
MNVAFHALTGLAIGQAAACVAQPEGREAGRPRLAIFAGALVLGVMAHGVLDGLPHEYPFRAVGDTLATAALVLPWMWLIEKRFRSLLLVALIGTVLPDVIDHVPRDLNRHLGTHLPEVTKIFPWHGRGGSGSLSGDAIPFRARVASVANHVIVVTFCAVTMVRARRVLRLG